jgi:uncharacterized membrane protein
VQNPSYLMIEANADKFLWLGKPNRSLTPSGRKLWLFLIGLNAFIIALVAFMIGAWLVVPFAGLEVALVTIAFYVIGRHDNDYEQLEFNADEFCWQRQHGRVFAELRGNKTWAQFLVKKVGREQQLFLRYAGKEVNVGSGLLEVERKHLAKNVGAKFIN